MCARGDAELAEQMLVRNPTFQPPTHPYAFAMSIFEPETVLNLYAQAKPASKQIEFKQKWRKAVRHILNLILNSEDR
jgi:hypothetical protein